MSLVLGLLFALPWTVPSFGAAIWLYAEYRHDLSAARTVEGTIEEVDPPGYSPTVTYSYTVDGVTYFSSGVYLFDHSPADGEDPRRRISTYTPGQPVPVHFPGGNPRKSFLERGDSSYAWGFVGGVSARPLAHLAGAIGCLMTVLGLQIAGFSFPSPLGLLVVGGLTLFAVAKIVAVLTSV